MLIISFAWTTPALLADRKTRTRRDWDDNYAKKFKKGILVAAYDRSPRVGGKQIGVIELTEIPYKEATCKAPPEDWEREGLAYLESNGTDFYQSDYEWQIGGLKFYQQTRNKRNKAEQAYWR